MPEDACPFARGDEVIASTGIPVKLSQPLDWLVVADHSENVGFFPDLKAGNLDTTPAVKTNDLLAGEYARESVFDAMAREEVYATTNSRNRFATGNASSKASRPARTSEPPSRCRSIRARRPRGR